MPTEAPPPTEDPVPIELEIGTEIVDCRCGNVFIREVGRRFKICPPCRAESEKRWSEQRLASAKRWQEENRERAIAHTKTYNARRRARRNGGGDRPVQP